MEKWDWFSLSPIFPISTGSISKVFQNPWNNPQMNGTILCLSVTNFLANSFWAFPICGEICNAGNWREKPSLLLKLCSRGGGNASSGFCFHCNTKNSHTVKHKINLVAEHTFLWAHAKPFTMKAYLLWNGAPHPKSRDTAGLYPCAGREIKLRCIDTKSKTQHMYKRAMWKSFTAPVAQQGVLRFPY